MLNNEETRILEELMENPQSFTEPVVKPNTEAIEQLTENPEFLRVNTVTSRFKDAEWFKAMKDISVSVIGLGGIGSHVAFLLSRLQVKYLYFYDNDKVESVNLAGQLFRTTDIHKYKTFTIQNFIQYYSNFYNTRSSTSRVNIDTKIYTPIIICGLDNMKSRKICFDKWKENMQILDNKDVCLFIDGRLSAEKFQVFAITGNDNRAIEKYEKEWLFSDEEAEESPCSYRQTTFIASMIASIITNIFVNFITNSCKPVVERPVPFSTFYDATTMFMKVEL